MSTNRTPISRTGRIRITPEAVKVFLQSEATRPTYIACIRGESCLSSNSTAHCDTCLSYLDAKRAMRRLLNIPIWAVFPESCDEACPWSPNCAAAIAWPDMIELRRALEVAASESQ